MNGVIGMCSLLANTELDEEQLDYVTTISNSGETLLSIINDILDFSKIEAGRLALETIPYHIDSLLREVTDLLGPEARKKHLKMSLQLNPELNLHRLGDPTRIRQVLVNLTSNAIKFTHDGEVQLMVEPAANPDEVLFKIKDTGIGMEQNRCEELFEPFVQADLSTTRRYGGTGLGLSISKMLVERMGGQLWVESEPDKGSTFFFTLVSPAEENSLKHSPDTASSQKTLKREFQTNGLRVLVAEDNNVNQKVAKLILTRLGCLAFCVANGREAVEACKRQPFDIVLMDLQMPEMDGITATRIIQEQIPLEKRPLIYAMTAGVSKKDYEATQDAGMDGFIGKPVKLEELREALYHAREKMKVMT